MRSISRRELYALGETLGESSTRRKLGGGYVCGGGGGGSSSSSTKTESIDKRQAVGDGAIGVTGDSNTLVITQTDQGAVSEAFKFATNANATNADGFTKLLSVGERLLTASQNQGEALIGQTQKAVADAWAVAQTTKSGAIDQKTMIVLAVVAAGTFAISKRGRA